MAAHPFHHGHSHHPSLLHSFIPASASNMSFLSFYSQLSQFTVLPQWTRQNVGHIDYGVRGLLICTSCVNYLQKSRAIARKPRDAAAVLFGLKFADGIHYKFKSSRARFEARLHSSKYTGTKQNSTQNGDSRSFKVTCFGVSGKAIRQKVIQYNNVGIICWGSDDIASTEDPQIFRGFQIFCRSADHCLLYSASRTSPLVTSRVINKRP